MTDIQGNVVLTADNSQYDQTMVASARQTDALTASVDTLTTKISQLTKSAGKTMLGIAAADVALIGSATAAYAAWERQMSQLHAQAAVLDRTMDKSSGTFKSYERSVQGLRKEFGTATSEAAALTQTIGKMSDHTTTISQLSRTFQQMSYATGEASTGLSQSLLTLQRTMGTPQRETRKYADQLTHLAATSNTTATALADFATQIAPIGKTLGMTQTEITGISKAFITAGQDGYQAMNAFNKIASDITYATQTGSPELAKYANLVGVTVEQFKQMAGAEKVISIFDRLNTMGPRAVAELNRMGLDGTRTLKAITAMSQQSGGLGSSIREAQQAYGDKSVERGSQAALSGMTDELAKIRSELTMTAETFGGTFAPAVEKSLIAVEKMSSGFNTLMGGPFGAFVKTIAAVVAPVAAFGGSLLLMSGTLAKLGAAALLLKGSGFLGFLQSYRGETGRIGQQADGTFGPMDPTRPLSKTGQQIAANGSWFQRMMFNIGVGNADRIQTARGAAYGLFNATPAQQSPTLGQRVLPITNAAMGATAFGLRNLVNPQFSPLTVAGMSDPTRRQRLFQSPTAAGSFATLVHSAPLIGHGGRLESSKVNAAVDDMAKKSMGAAAATAAQTRAVQASTQATTRQATGFAALMKATAQLAGTMTSASLGAAGTGLKYAGRAGATIGAGAVSLLGGPVGATITAALMAPAAISLIKSLTDDNKEAVKPMNLGGFADPYRQAAGLGSMPTAFSATGNPAAPTSVGAAKILTAQDRLTAGAKNYQMTNTKLKGLNPDQAVRVLSTGWSSISKSPAALQAVQLDLFAEYGDPDTVRDIMNRLNTGDYKTLSADLGSLSARDSSARQQSFNVAAGVAADRTNLAFAEGGETAARKEASNQILDILLATSKEPSLKSMGGGLASLSETFKMNLKADDMIQVVEGFRQLQQPGMLAGTRDPKTQADLLKGIFLREDIDGDGKAEPRSEGQRNVGREFLKALDLDTTLYGQEAIDTITKALDAKISMLPEQKTQLQQRSIIGGAVGGSKALENAELLTENAGAFYNAVDVVGREANKMKSPLAAIEDLSEGMAAIGDPSSVSYQVFQTVRNRSISGLQAQAPLLSRQDQYRQQAQILGSLAAGGNPNDRETIEQMKLQFMQSTVDQAAFFKQQLIQQEQFEMQMSRAQEDFDVSRGRMEQQYNLSRARAQDDFQTQRMYQEADFAKARRRANADFELSRERSSEAFGRSQRRAQADFNTSRKRNEIDHNHQVRLMQEQAAQSLYNIYERVNVQRTASSSFLLVNAQDQLDRMEQQSENLDKLRRMGLSDKAIQQLGFTKSENAQQLNRFTAEAAEDPKIIKQMNEAVRKRLRAARDLVTDESSKDWEEFQRQYRISTSRAQRDFEKQVRRSHQDFNIQMDQMGDDFRKSMSRQGDDFETAQDRQQKQFSKSMNRAAKDYGIAVAQMRDDFHKSMRRAQEDMDFMSRSISMSLKEAMVRSTKELNRESRKQAREVLRTFTNLDDVLGQEGVDLMQTMAKIFGFKYTPPKMTNAPSGNKFDYEFGRGYAQGGVLPGYTPGRDIHQFSSPTGGKIQLSGGEAIMVPEWVRAMGGPKAVEAMNHAARHGQAFADGGVFKNPDKKVYMDGEPVSAITKAQVLLAEKLSKMDFRVMQGSWQPYTSYSGSSHMGAGVIDTGPGSFAAQYWLRRVGFAAWARNIPGAAYAGSGAHVHSVSRLDPGSRHHSQLSSFARGEDGLGGRDYGPNPGLLPGLLDRLNEFHNLAISGGNAMRAMGDLNAILKDTYPEVEKAAKQVKLMGGLFEKGFWSDKLNKYAKHALDKRGINWAGEGAIVEGTQIMGVGERGPEMVLPLDGRGVDFVGSLLAKMSGGREGFGRYVHGSTPACSHTETTYNIDRSTTFSGAITVQANNPGELIAQLKARQRVQALSQASLGGARV